jgi:hypothetical protein
MASQAIQRLGKEDILRAAGNFRPARKMQKWVVIINGKEYPARPLLLHAAGVAPNDPTNSHQAVAKFQELGFETRYADDLIKTRPVTNSESERGGHCSAELQWLASNRKDYAGQWVALQGDRLLASGADAREVFLKVRQIVPPPVVVRVEEENLPFAGW